jgi:hypothetical protein
MENDYTRAFSVSHNTFSEFENNAKAAISSFIIDNKVIQSIETGKFDVKMYHKLLISIFHQVYNSSGSFALAGSMCNTSQIVERQYLFHHAEEEMTHWQWILNDLKSTGYAGPDPRDLLPAPNTTAYLSYAYYLALKFPVGRLAMALVLEGISGSFGLKYGARVLMNLKLRPDQAQFFMAHGELDQGHEADIIKILSKSNLSPSDLAQLSHVATTTAELYKRIYNDVA